MAAHGTPQQVALRCRIVLSAAAGETNQAIAAAAQVDVKTVALWRRRFAEAGPQGLWEIAAGRGRKPTHSPDKIKAIVHATLTTKPRGMTEWSCRQMAQAQGVGKSTVSNIWRSHNLKPHRIKSFKLSRDARFLEKLTDVVGLYLNPPRSGFGALRGREDPDPGIGPHPARIAHEEGASGHDDPQLQAQRHDLSVRRARSAARKSRRSVFQPASSSGVGDLRSCQWRSQIVPTNF